MSENKRWFEIQDKHGMRHYVKAHGKSTFGDRTDFYDLIPRVVTTKRFLRKDKVKTVNDVKYIASFSEPIYLKEVDPNEVGVSLHE